MMFKNTNIEERLRSTRNKTTHLEVLQEVQALLESSAMKQAKIAAELSSKDGSHSNAFQFDSLETENIFHISQIKEICIDYRLRFLESRYFKG